MKEHKDKNFGQQQTLLGTICPADDPAEDVFS
jgi:hypothetical protein